MERRRSAVLAADIVGYSRMMGADESGTLARVQAWRRELFDAAVARHGGRIVKLMGDGALVVFPDPADAVRFAVALQEEMLRREANTPEERRIILRIGINFGEIIHEDGDIFGDGVNIAARLEGMADPGGVLVSEAVRDAVAATVGIQFHPNGARKFKNIAHPIRVWSWPEMLAARRPESKPRIHVAPFEGNSGEERALAADLGGEIGARLARLTGLEVSADPKGAYYRLEGGVRLGSGRSRVYARLIAADDARQIWADRYDRDADPFAILDATAPRIVMSVRRRVAADDAERLRARPLDELSFNELLALAGASFFNPTREGWRGGGLFAEQALALEPGHFMALAMAAAGLGLEEPLYGTRAVEAPVLRLALDRIDAALRGNNRSDMLHATHAGLLLYGPGRLREAAAAAQCSIEFNEDYNMGLWNLASVRVFQGAYDEGAQLAERAVEIEPLDPYVHLYSRMAGYARLAAGRIEAALDWFHRADQLAPGVAPNLVALVAAHHAAGDRDGAAEALDRLLRAEPGFRLRQLHPLPFADPQARSAIPAALRAVGAPD